MKYCVVCHINKGSNFVDGKCPDCYDGVTIVPAPVANNLFVKCWYCGEKYAGAQCRCKSRKKSRIKKQLTYIQNPNFLSADVKLSEAKPFIPKTVCVFCLLPESEDNHFYTFHSQGHLVRTRKHITCRLEYKEKQLNNRLQYKREYYAKHKPETTPKKRGKVALSEAEKMALLPERQVCIGCEKEKHVSDFYFDEKRIKYYSKCKICFGERNKQSKNKHSVAHLIYNNLYHYAFNTNKNRK